MGGGGGGGGEFQIPIILHYNYLLYGKIVPPKKIEHSVGPAHRKLW